MNKAKQAVVGDEVGESVQVPLRVVVKRARLRVSTSVKTGGLTSGNAPCLLTDPTNIGIGCMHHG